MSDSDDFVNGLRDQYGEPGHDNSHPMAPWGGDVLQAGLEYGGAFARGALKQAALAPGIRSIEPQSIIDYANEKDPKHPNVEAAGRYVTPTSVVLGRLPDLPALAASAAASWPVRTASTLAQNAWKSTLGGAAEADTDTPSGNEAGRRIVRGAGEGLGTSLGLSAAQSALRVVPRWMLPAVVAGAQLAHGGHYLWRDVRHAMAEGLAMLAARAAKVPAGLVGAGGEAASQQAGYEPGGSREEHDPF